MGIPKDAKQAYVWLELAAKDNHEGARVAREDLSKLMTAEDIANAKLAASEWQPKFPTKPST